MNNLFREIKWAYQRVVRGYDDRIYWEMDSYLFQLVEPIKKFCEKELNEEYLKLNPKRKEVYETTLKLAKEVEEMYYEDWYESDNSVTRFWAYFGGNITIYWT